MSSFSGTRFGPGCRRSKRAFSAMAFCAWTLSLVVHGTVLTGMGYVGLTSGKSNGSGGANRGEVMIMGGWAERQESASPSIVSFTATMSRAPELLPPVRQPMVDANVKPASATMSVEQPPRAPIRATNAASGTASTAGQGANTAETQVFGLRSRGA